MGRVEQLTFDVLVAEGLHAHVAEANGALRRGKREDSAARGVELGGSDHLREVLHIRRLHVHDICIASIHQHAT